MAATPDIEEIKGRNVPKFYSWVKNSTIALVLLTAAFVSNHSNIAQGSSLQVNPISHSQADRAMGRTPSLKNHLAFTMSIILPKGHNGYPPFSLVSYADMLGEIDELESVFKNFDVRHQDLDKPVLFFHRYSWASTDEESLLKRVASENTKYQILLLLLKLGYYDGPDFEFCDDQGRKAVTVPQGFKLTGNVGPITLNKLVKAWGRGLDNIRKDLTTEYQKSTSNRAQVAEVHDRLEKLIVIHPDAAMSGEAIAQRGKEIFAIAKGQWFYAADAFGILAPNKNSADLKVLGDYRERVVDENIGPEQIGFAWVPGGYLGQIHQLLMKEDQFITFLLALNDKSPETAEKLIDRVELDVKSIKTGREKTLPLPEGHKIVTRWSTRDNEYGVNTFEIKGKYLLIDHDQHPAARTHLIENGFTTIEYGHFSSFMATFLSANRVRFENTSKSQNSTLFWDIVPNAAMTSWKIGDFQKLDRITVAAILNQWEETAVENKIELGPRFNSQISRSQSIEFRLDPISDQPQIEKITLAFDFEKHQWELTINQQTKRVLVEEGSKRKINSVHRQVFKYKFEYDRFTQTLGETFSPPIYGLDAHGQAVGVPSRQTLTQISVDADGTLILSVDPKIIQSLNKFKYPLSVKGLKIVPSAAMASEKEIRDLDLTIRHKQNEISSEARRYNSWKKTHGWLLREFGHSTSPNAKSSTQRRLEGELQFLQKERSRKINPDKASLAPPAKYGGIDLSTSNGMRWKDSKDGNGVEMDIDPVMIARIRKEGINRLSAVVLRMTPVASIWPLAGIQAPVK